MTSSVLACRANCRYNLGQMANELRSVVRELGGERALGRAMMNDRDLREAIREGFPHAVLEELMQAAGLTLKELARCAGPLFSQLAAAAPRPAGTV